jgi:hypothetical protein
MLFKWLGENGEPANGGRGKWYLPKGKRPGKWMPKLDDLDPCVRGYHLCRVDDLPHWIAPTLWLVEYRGERIDAEDKVVVAQARLIRQLTGWNTRTARLFAADCAERVLPNWEKKHPGDDRIRKTIETVRQYANDEATKDELRAAYLAARSAADSAADSAAYSAARWAAYSAADSAAYWAADSAAYWAARWAAYSAAYSAAYLAADSAARLAAYLAAGSAADLAARSAAGWAAYSAAHWAAYSAADLEARKWQARRILHYANKGA